MFCLHSGGLQPGVGLNTAFNRSFPAECGSSHCASGSFHAITRGFHAGRPMFQAEASCFHAESDPFHAVQLLSLRTEVFSRQTDITLPRGITPPPLCNRQFPACFTHQLPACLPAARQFPKTTQTAGPQSKQPPPNSSKTTVLNNKSARRPLSGVRISGGSRREVLFPSGGDHRL